MTSDEISVGNAKLELLLHKGEFLGLGVIAIDQVIVRSNSIPLRPLLLCVDGVAFGQFMVTDISESEEATTLTIKSKGVATGQSLYLDHLGIHTARFAPDSKPEIVLRWVIRPSEYVTDDEIYRGVSWHYEVESPDNRFVELTEQGSWEIGGTVDGNRLLYQGEHLAPETKLTAETVVNSSWSLPDDVLGDTPAASIERARRERHPLCAVPLRVAKNQPFDFLAHRSGNFTTFFGSNMEYVGCMMLKERGQTILPWLERYRSCETTRFVTPERYVLFSKSAQPASSAKSRNQWTRIHDYIASSLRKAHNIHEFRNPTMASMCTWFAWNEAVPKSEYLTKAGRYLEMLGKIFMPLFGKMGFTSYYLHPIWRSAMPDVPHCAVADFEPDPVVGDWETLRLFNEQSSAAGIRIYPWVSMHLWHEAPIFEQHPEWKIKSRDTFNFTPGYPNVLAQVDLAGGYADHLFERLKTVRQRTGISGLFFDTPCTHAMYNISWHRQSETHVKAVADLFGRLSAIGYDLGGEAVTPFIRSMRGEDALQSGFRMMGLEKSHPNYSGWANYKMGLLGPHRRHTPSGTLEWDESYYRRLANRCTCTIGFDTPSSSMFEVNDAHARRIEQMWTQQATRANLDYNAAESHMFKRTLLEDDAGVLWEDELEKVKHLFCFKAHRYPVRATRVTCLTTGNPLNPSDEILCQSYHTYRIDA